MIALVRPFMPRDLPQVNYFTCNCRTLNLIQADVPGGIVRTAGFSARNQVGIYESRFRLEQVCGQPPWTTFDPMSVHYGARYDPILRFHFQ